MSATVKQTQKTGFGECHVASGVRLEEGHFAPEAKIANDKL
jgi:hypothetical protein